MSGLVEIVANGDNTRFTEAASWGILASPGGTRAGGTQRVPTTWAVASNSRSMKGDSHDH